MHYLKNILCLELASSDSDSQINAYVFYLCSVFSLKDTKKNYFTFQFPFQKTGHQYSCQRCQKDKNRRRC